jgi:hypothetical protein
MVKLLVEIGSRRLRWFGHVSRMPEQRLPKYLLDWKPKHGKRSRGRPRKSLNGAFIEDAEKRMNRSGLISYHDRWNEKSGFR